jgi:hypothetical protein
MLTPKSRCSRSLHICSAPTLPLRLQPSDLSVFCHLARAFTSSRSCRARSIDHACHVLGNAGMLSTVLSQPCASSRLSSVGSAERPREHVFSPYAPFYLGCMDELTVDAGVAWCLPACQQVRSLPLQHGALCRRDNFFQLLQGSGDGPSLRTCSCRATTRRVPAPEGTSVVIRLAFLVILGCHRKASNERMPLQTGNTAQRS